MMKPSLVIHGALGRMGQALLTSAREQGFEVAATLDQGDDIARGIGCGDVVIDFSVASATKPLAILASQAGKPLVIGTTGHSPAERKAITAILENIPVVWAGNYSIGVNLLFHLTSLAAKLLPERYQPEIVEMHHRHKLDAPSGTAARLAEVIREARQWPAESEQHGRHGMTGARPDRQVGIHALRGGDVVGDHEVVFATDGERLELGHRASSRRIFADGAIRAAEWVQQQSPGVYDMQDVLGLKA